MRFSQVVGCVFLLAALCAAQTRSSEIRIKVVDPQSAAVAGAQVVLLRNGSDVPLEVQTTSAEGVAVFHRSKPAREAGEARGPELTVRVLAPGFAAETTDISRSENPVTIKLRLASTMEAVTVTATRAPAPTEDAVAAVDSLSGPQITTMQPVAANDALRYLTGAVIETTGQRGQISSMFVRGGDSRYNKVIIDGVTVNDPGGTFDFGVVPLDQADRLEFVRGAQSTLYGSDAMTSVVQMWTRDGSSETPELRLGADGGTFQTAHGYASLAGARGRFDYNLFGDEFNTNGQGPNAEYSNSLEGANIGATVNDRVSLRLRVRHNNAFSGVPSEWKFNGAALMPPDSDQWQRQSNLLGSVELNIAGPSRWTHRLNGFEYNHHRTNIDSVDDPGRIFDTPFHSIADINRAGFEYQGDYIQRTWARATIGYEFEDENGFTGDLLYPPTLHGLRLNQAVYGQEMLTLGRLSIVAGARFVHNATFGNKGVPRVALGLQVLRGGSIFSGTRLRFSYATGIKEPRFEEAFATGPFIVPNPNLEAEENRAFEAGVDQSFAGGKYSLSATYFNNLYRHQIDFLIVDFNTFTGEYMNINKSMAHGAEVQFQGRLSREISLTAGYNYDSTQILEAPAAFDALHAPGSPLIRRPKHSGSLLLTYLGDRWGGNLAGSFVGPRPDSDFLGFNINHAAGYARVDLGLWYAINSRITAYVNGENLLNRHYEEVVGYPALTANFRAGMRFRIGGE